MAATIPVFDPWTQLDHKDEVRTANQPSAAVPSWVGRHARRLAAYKVLLAYQENSARVFLSAAVGEALAGELSVEQVVALAEEARRARREYGDAEMIVGRAVDALLGDDVEIVVPDAAGEEPAEPELPPEPEAPAEGADEVARRIAEVRRARWESDALEAVDEWEASIARWVAGRERQAWLRNWADTVDLAGKMVEAETDAVGLGDGVYVLGWSARAQRPELRVYDPGFYFPPVLEGDDVDVDSDYPGRLHLAWEFEEGDRRFLRRITWELGPITVDVDDDGNPRFDEATGRVLLRDGDRFDAEGRIVRTYPWATEPSDVTCYLTDATWPMDVVRDDLVDLDPSRATYRLNDDGEVLRRLDLRIDFIPVVHIPNVPASKQHFGRSILAAIAQLLDEIQATDTDLASAASLAGSPPIAVSGAGERAGQVATYGPGSLFYLGDGGQLSTVETAGALDPLMSQLTSLLDRAAVNSRMTSEGLGRVETTEVESGILLLLAMAPLTALVRRMRLVRRRKYRLLLRFAQRLAQAGGVLPAGLNPDAEVVFGSFLPSDAKQTVDLVVALLDRHGISRQTSLNWLAKAGLDVGDVSEELARVAGEDFDGADKLSLVVGDEAAAEYLGREAPAAPVAPRVVLPEPEGEE